jgi:hypothetical protein
MQRLNQVLAAEKSAKTHAEKETTALYHTLEKPALFEGFSRTYQPNREDGEKFPSETQVVQQRVDDVFAGIRRNMAAVWDITAAKDYANLEARADVVIGGAVILGTDELVPMGVVMATELALLDAERGEDGFTGERLSVGVSGYPPAVYVLWKMTWYSLIVPLLFLPEDAAAIQRAAAEVGGSP